VKENQLETRFKGFDISKVPYTVDKFTCKACANQCEIRRIRIEGEKEAPVLRRQVRKVGDG
jgi:hypothetical protein